MSARQKLYWLLVAATTLVYGALIFGYGPQLIGMSSFGGWPFDLRMGGYSAQEARSYIASLGADGVALYIGPVMWLDTFFPAMFALVIGIAMWTLLAKRGRVLQVGSALITVAYMVFDYLENATLYKMMSIDLDLLPDNLIENASRWTILKFTFVDAMITILVTLLILRLVNKKAESPTPDGETG
ncbi:MAG: hypothetical protein GXP05_12290 [Alphaproteobacteria bacterium]|nr:hypothetical protein [Alphaproteobacteria bacterium]